MTWNGPLPTPAAKFLKTATGRVQVNGDNPAAIGEVLTIVGLEAAEWAPPATGPAEDLKTLTGSVAIATSDASAGQVLTADSGTGATWTTPAPALWTDDGSITELVTNHTVSLGPTLLDSAKMFSNRALYAEASGNMIIHVDTSASEVGARNLYTRGGGAFAEKIGFGAEAGDRSVAVGSGASEVIPQEDSVAIGYQAARGNQGHYSIAIGSSAALNNAGDGTTVVGTGAGVCVGGGESVGDNSVVLGLRAARTGCPANTVVVDGAGSNLSPATAGVFINPVAAETTSNKMLTYNTTTKEVAYSATESSSSTISITNGVDQYAIDATGGRYTGNTEAVFQRAILDLAGVGTIYVGTGTYNCTEAINANTAITDITIIGLGEVVVAQTTASDWFQQSTGAPTFHVENIAFTVADTCKIWSLANATTAHNSSFTRCSFTCIAGATGRFLYDNQALATTPCMLVDNCDFDFSACAGAFAAISGGNGRLACWTVVDCRVIGAVGSYFVTGSGTIAQPLTLIRCTIDNCNIGTTAQTTKCTIRDSTLNNVLLQLKSTTDVNTLILSNTTITNTSDPCITVTTATAKPFDLFIKDCTLSGVPNVLTVANTCTIKLDVTGGSGDFTYNTSGGTTTFDDASVCELPTKTRTSAFLPTNVPKYATALTSDYGWMRFNDPAWGMSMPSAEMPLAELTYQDLDPLTQYNQPFAVADTYYPIGRANSGLPPPDDIPMSPSLHPAAPRHFEQTTPGLLKYIGLTPQYCHIAVSMSAAGTANSKEFQFALDLNDSGSAYAGSVYKWKLINSGDYTSFAMHKVVLLSENDTISCLAANISDLSDLAIENFNLVAMGIKASLV